MTKPLTRLPCRGCLASCKSYTICGGYPWRINQTAHLVDETTKDVAEKKSLKTK